MNNNSNKSFAGATVLVTGGAGFVGSNLVKELLKNEIASIHIVDNLLSAELINVPDDERVTFSESSIADDALLAKLNDDYDYIFHLSTFHGNQNSMADPLADHDNNLITSLKLFERLKNFKRLKKVVYSGAGCAVAEKTFDQACATSEDAPISLQMDSPYSISKIVGEFYAVYYFNRHNLPTVRARFQNVYGPGEILGAGKWRGTAATIWRNVIPTFIYKALNGEALPIEGSGEATRDFIYVDDIVNGLMCCALNGIPGDVYNLASGVETSILALAEMINKITGNKTPIQILPRRDWDHSGKRYGDPKKALQEISFKAEKNIEDGLQVTVNWTKERQSFINNCIEKHSAYLLNPNNGVN
jgi:UDP-glucose 4-epimerase